MNTEKVRVVLDTNIIISAFISPLGAPAEIFELFLEGNIINYTSEEIIKEVVIVIHRPEFIGCIEHHDKQFMLDNFRTLSLIIKPNSKDKVIKEDPKNDKFINCALDANATIISGDKHLLSLGKYEGITILSPREFLERLK